MTMATSACLWPWCVQGRRVYLRREVCRRKPQPQDEALGLPTVPTRPALSAAPLLPLSRPPPRLLSFSLCPLFSLYSRISAGCFVDGERWAGYQRIAVFHHHGEIVRAGLNPEPETLNSTRLGLRSFAVQGHRRLMSRRLHV